MSNKINNFYEFGDFRLDSQAKILYHAGAPVPLKPKAIETLLVLVENAGEVVGKTDLMNLVWRDAFVEENNLSVNIYHIRKTLAGYDGEQTYIQTIPRRGFRFAVPLIETDEARFNGNRSIENSAGISTDDSSAVEQVALVSSTPNGHSADDAIADSVFNRFSDDKPENRQPPKFKRRSSVMPFARRNLAIAVLIIFSSVAVGSSIFVLRENQSRAAASKNSAAKPETDQPERGTKNIEARQFYLRGRELWQTRENPKMTEGIGFFHRAIELDPNYVAPYLGIADSLSMMRNDLEDWRVAEEYANKAIALAPDSAEAHATLGFIHALNKWQWRAAENYFQKALFLDADSGKTHQWYATLLLIERRFEEAEAHLKRAIEIEPLSPNYNADLCEFYAVTARNDEALTQCRRTNEINPDFHFAYFEKDFYIRQKRFDEAAAVWLNVTVRSGVPEDAARRQGWYRAFKKDGFRGWMLEGIENNKRHPDHLLGTWNTTLTYAKLGDREKTLEHLKKTLAGRAFLLPFANAYPEFDFLRGDPEFQAVMHRVGLN